MRNGTGGQADRAGATVPVETECDGFPGADPSTRRGSCGPLCKSQNTWPLGLFFFLVSLAFCDTEPPTSTFLFLKTRPRWPRGNKASAPPWRSPAAPEHQQVTRIPTTLGTRRGGRPQAPNTGDSPPPSIKRDAVLSLNKGRKRVRNTAASRGDSPGSLRRP